MLLTQTENGQKRQNGTRSIGTWLVILFINTCIFIAVALDETSVLVAVRFSMKKKITCPVRQSNVDISQ